MTLQGIVTSFLVTGKSLDEVGARYVSLWLRCKGEDYSVVIKALPSQDATPGDELAIELDPSKPLKRNVTGLPQRIRVTRRAVLRPVTVDATITEIAWLDDDNNFGAKLRVRNPQVESARGKGAYISFVKGSAPRHVKLKRGALTTLTGFVFHRHNGSAEMVIADKGVTLRPDKSVSNPVIVAARRSMRLSTASASGQPPTRSGGEAVKDYAQLLTASKRERLERELGHEWPVTIAGDRSLLDGDAFAKWNAEFKDALAKACAAIKSRLSGLESDLLSCEVSDDAIANVVACYFPDENNMSAQFSGGDAMVMVRAGYLSFVQAKRLNELAQFFTASLPPSLGALWDYVRVAQERGNSAISLHEARQWMRMQDGFSDGKIDAAFAFVEQRVALAASLLGEDNHKLVFVGAKYVIAYEEIARVEAKLRARVGNLNEPISFKLGPFQDEDIANDADQSAAVNTSLTRRISIITGGPGTGKTSTMKEIVSQLSEDAPDCAGGATAVTISARAARVIEKMADVEALTFEQFKHRYFKATKNNYLSPRRALIIDETSMFSSSDLETALTIAASVGYERVILAGDMDQLPPIGWGAPFADLIKSNACPVTYLNTIHRTDAGGGIAQICRDVRMGNAIRRDYSNVEIFDADNSDIAPQIADIYSGLVASGVEPSEIMVLSPYSAENQDFGAPALSLGIRNALGLPDRLTKGDIVIGVKNERSPRYILNGSRGIVVHEGREREGVDYRSQCPRVNSKEKPEYDACSACRGDTTVIKFDCARDDTEVEHYCPAEIKMRGSERPITGQGKGARRARDIRRAVPPKTSWGYASGVHKAQGGEARYVIAVVTKAVPATFGKAALYTAFSRASDALIIVGDFDAIPGIVARTRERLTVLGAERGEGAPALPRSSRRQGAEAVDDNENVAF